MTEKSTKFVIIIVFWCIVLVHTNSNYELNVHFRGMTISTEKPTKPVNSRRYHKIIYDNGKYYQNFPFWGGRGRKFKSCHSDQKGDSSESPFFFVFLRLSLVFSLFVFSFLFRETFENRGFLADFSDCYLKLLPKFFAFPFRTPNCYSKSFTTIE